MNEVQLAAWLDNFSGQGVKACIGLDGFVDRIIRVVDKRISPTEHTYVRTLGDYGNMVSAAAGLSLNVEIIPKVQKLGGNGPIMANAMARLGAEVSCVGAFGLPAPTPEYTEMGKRVALYSVAQPACTDAYEFDDGKIMASALESLNTLSWDTLMGALGVEMLVRLFEQAELIALNNWTMIPHMSHIWRHLQEDVFPRLTPRRRVIFLDLADPAKRTKGDIRRAIETMAGFSPFGEVYLSCNKREAMILSRVLGEEADGADMGAAAQILQERLHIAAVSIHTLEGSFACVQGEVIAAPGFFVDKPLISVGGGDHFNAGLAWGMMSGLPMYDAMVLASAVSGYYVRTGVTPDRSQLAEFLRTEKAGA